MRRPTPHRSVNALLTGLFLALLATCLKGVAIGLCRRGADWGWLALPLDAVAAPLLLIPDLLMLGAGQYDRLVVLPWAAAGFVVGAAWALMRKR